MKDFVLAYYAAIAIATVTFIVMAPDIPDRPRPTPEQCSVAEIAPDMTPRDREVCRQLRQQRHRL
jgi:hypothetical protein